MWTLCGRYMEAIWTLYGIYSLTRKGKGTICVSEGLQYELSIKKHLQIKNH